MYNLGDISLARITALLPVGAVVIFLSLAQAAGSDDQSPRGVNGKLMSIATMGAQRIHLYLSQVHLTFMMIRLPLHQLI